MGVEWTELAYYGGSFTCLPKDIRLKLYELAHKTGISRLRFSTSPDCIDETVIKEAVKNNVQVVELGVQSLDDEVLKANRRPCGSAESVRAFRLVKDCVETAGIQLMTGLYKETPESFRRTVDEAVSLGADYARIYPCVVLEDTELADMYADGRYIPLTLTEAVSRCAYAYILLTASGCDVIRIGLHDSESVKESALAGAYHPAMGDMAKTVAILIYLNLGNEINVEQKYLSSVCGYGGIVKKMFRDRVVLKDGTRPDFIEITKEILRGSGEDYKRKIQEQTDSFAERLISETHNR